MSEQVAVQTPGRVVGNYQPTLLNNNDYNHTLEEEGSDIWPPAKYPNYLPVWEHHGEFPAIGAFAHHDPGLDADPALSNVLPQGSVVSDLTPGIGSEVHGVQLTALSKAGKDELALLVAQRKVVVFRDQDFADLPIPEALEYCKHFGPLNIHPTTGSPRGYPEVHLAHRGAGDKTMEKIFGARTNSITWHSDTSFELQPAGTTFMYILEQPKAGGDTIFSDNVEAYNRLSDSFKKILQRQQAVHSGIQLAESSRARGGIVRREPVMSTHPIVRTHPVTREKALFVNPHYVGHIVGFKKEESEALLKYLFDHIASGLDFHVRVKWEEKSVVVWDNRLTNHAATFDWSTGERRHLARITPQAERPFETLLEGSKRTSM